jgi:hypothetical protein
MTRTCTICTHKDIEKINKQLISGVTLRDIANQFGTSKSSLERHKAGHLPKTIAKAQEVQEIAQADSLLDQLTNLREKALDILQKAEDSGDLKTALMGIREARGCLELLAKIEGQLNDRPQINIYLTEQWRQVGIVLLRALQEYPEARQKAAIAIMDLERGQA